MAKVKVGVNGYGTIGKRVADAILLQDDMELVGVSKTKPDFIAKIASSKGINIYVPEGSEETFENKGVKVSGTIEDLITKVDVIVDATPGGVGAQNKPLYEKHGVKAIFQGGEKHEVAGFSFNAYVNYNDAKRRKFVRVVSCNTTGLLRTLHVINELYGIKEAFAVIIRRAADPADDKAGIINTLEPAIPVPSHHGPDVRTVLDVPIETMAVKTPTTLMHLHALQVKTEKKPNKEELLETFSSYKRILLVSKNLGIKSTAKIVEIARDLGRKRYDIYEVVLWEDSISVKDYSIYLYQAVHQEAIVVPENIDAIRAMFELAEKEESIKKTDESLSIGTLEL
ncbi:MAG: type II glyceraldehyde-3-phosphate dehydrogenase [Thermoplasmata archaeon]|nr:type II glyceraldehyde-3-phosphate dehydrogenase [Euryarchaeota archaeon]RLF67285.1 MAG: type II glyceraldehyde-3-phosphate dehydrogenase [Thermoplasmata archaeon]